MKNSSRQIGGWPCGRIAVVLAVASFLSSAMVLTAQGAETRRYSGFTGKVKAVFDLTWNDDGTVEGTYSCPGHSTKVYALRGDNKTAGKLRLDEFTDGTLSARIVLEKEATTQGITWEGWMHNVDGRKINVTMSRAKGDVAIPPAADSRLYTEEPVTVLNETVWPQPPRMREKLERDGFSQREQAFGAFGRITGNVTQCGYEAGGLRIRLELKADEDTYSHKRFVPRLKNVSLLVTDYPVRPLFLRAGGKFSGSVSQRGEIVTLYLGEYAITHWRKRDDGLVEIQAISSKVGDRPSASAVAALEKQSMHLLPDKLASSTYDAELPWKSMSLHKDFGLVLRVTDAGPGELELESALPSLRPAGERPWISVFDRTADKEVPPEQRAYDAG